MYSEALTSEVKSSRFSVDPRTKIYILLILSFTMVNGSTIKAEGCTIPIFALLPALMLLFEKKIKITCIYIVIFGLSWFCDLFLLRQVNGFWGTLFAIFIAFGIHMGPSAVMGYYLFTTTHASEFIAAMERIHMPQCITIPLSVVFRFFPTIIEESQAINDAMRMRGIGLKNGTSSLGVILEYRIIPLIMSIVTIGNELSAAALTRGLGGKEKRTNISKIGFHFIDLFLVAYVTITLIAFVKLRFF